MNITEDHLSNDFKTFTFSNSHGMSVQALNQGGIITEINVPDRTGTIENVVLSYQDYEDYIEDPNYFGAIIGRVAGRIETASFQINGKEFQLDQNDGVNSLHGGNRGFHTKKWDASPFQTEDSAGVVFTYRSPHLEGGYPGNITAAVTYTLNNNNQLIIDYSAVSDHDTPITLTNHSYFNLSGNMQRTIGNHDVQINSDGFVELDENLIPTGKILDVGNTVFDLRKSVLLEPLLHSSDKQVQLANGGFDHYFLLNPNSNKQAVVKDEESGRILELQTNQQGLVFYTGNNLTDGRKLAHSQWKKHLGLCLETQASPASLHHDGFPSVCLKAGETYERQTIFTFKTM
ncbi:aldose epimerase family protein [Halobacillus andaensis]|uniref:aldose epimerase family protein n=1 Tax=Halobacillus andaensis TaxID=1176239 RepID=UPI003D708B2B